MTHRVRVANTGLKVAGFSMSCDMSARAAGTGKGLRKGERFNKLTSRIGSEAPRLRSMKERRCSALAVFRTLPSMLRPRKVRLPRSYRTSGQHGGHLKPAAQAWSCLKLK